MYDWDNDRKEQVKRVKNICYYAPSLLKKKAHRKGGRSRRRGATGESITGEPNKQLFDLYQQSLRQSAALEEGDGVADDQEANPRVASQATDNRPSGPNQKPPLASVNETPLEDSKLPDVHPSSTKN